MRELAERIYFVVSRAFGRVLRAGTYSKTQLLTSGNELQVRKHRRLYAPLLVWLGEPLTNVLGTGVRVLPQQDWEERERMIYRYLRNSSIRIDSGGALILPPLPGKTLATLLDDPQLDEAIRGKAIELAVSALAQFHSQGFTHGDAMAENVMIDLESEVAHWFDFETVHDSNRPLAWRRADDLRALLATCLLRTAPEAFAKTLKLILDVYASEEVSRLLPASFASVMQRPLPFHLGQAPLSFRDYDAITRLLSERIGE